MKRPITEEEISQAATQPASVKSTLGLWIVEVKLSLSTYSVSSTLDYIRISGVEDLSSKSLQSSQEARPLVGSCYKNEHRYMA